MKDFYQSQLKDIAQNHVALQKTYNKTSTYRLLLLIGGLILVFKSFQIQPIFGSICLLIFLGGFYYLVKFHEKTENAVSQNENKRILIENELEVLETRKNPQYNNGDQYADPHHIFSGDLDLFGDYSVYSLINRAKTQLGLHYLADNILKIETEKSEILKKQDAVKELANKTEWRLNFLASVINIKKEQANVSSKISNVPLPPKLALESFLSIYGKIVPIFWLALFVYFGFFQIDKLGFAAGGLILFHFYLNGLNKKLTEPFLEQIAVTGRALESYSLAAELIANQSFESEKLKEILKDFPHSELKLANPIEGFSMIVKKLEIRKNMLAAIFLTMYRPFEPIETLHLGKWLTKNPTFFKEIFNAIGQLEFYSGLGTLAFNNPNWAFPEVFTEGKTYISTKQVGHPLILGHQTVCNDFALADANRVNLITGSNMSGKSTFLRTLGINIILGNLGGPVFAKKFEFLLGLKPLCYMRITDSIHENASTFKAEIDRIKLVLAAVKTKEKYLFLIDEMLRGTNSEDKLKGSMALFEKLVSEGAIAMLATHDLRLSEISGKHTNCVKNYYFEYSTDHGELIFDYLIKEGICKSFNASILLKNIGLDMS